MTHLLAEIVVIILFIFLAYFIVIQLINFIEVIICLCKASLFLNTGNYFILFI